MYLQLLYFLSKTLTVSVIVIHRPFMILKQSMKGEQLRETMVQLM